MTQQSKFIRNFKGIWDPKKISWEDNIKMDLQEVGWGAWNGLIWVRIRTGGELF